MLQRAGVDPRAYRDQPLRRRIPACLRILRCRDEDEARALLRERPEAVDRALEALLIGVTALFRDPAVFEAIRAEVVPGLCRRPGTLRVWSAGCARGAELWSVAALLDEAGQLQRCTLLGTDCRQGAIDDAARLLPERAFPEGFAELASGFDAIPGAGLRPRLRLRQRVAWKRADLVGAVEPGPWDLVLWRNVAIYMIAAAADAVASAIAGTLAPGGFLVVGRAERLDAARLELEELPRGVYRKQGSPRAI